VKYHKNSINKGTIYMVNCFTKIILILILVLIFSPLKAEKLPQWQYQQLPSKPSLRGSAVFGNSLWVTGSNNSVFVSQNGGKTWRDKSVAITKEQPVTGFRDITLFDKNTAIVMGVGNGKASRLYKTIDGGNHWQLLYQNTDEQGFFDSIAFWDKQTGLLLGDPVDGFYVVKKTTDGGKTWRRINKTKIPTMIENEAAFAASGNTLIVGLNGKAWFTTGGFSASVYHSTDFGETWLRSSVPLHNKTATSGGYALALNPAGKLFVLGGDYKNRQQGYANMAMFHQNQWQVVKSSNANNSASYGLRTAMSCQRYICISTGKTSTDISYNAGKTWQKLNRLQPLPFVENEQGFYTLASDNLLFLAAGEQGKVAVLSFRP
jgi:photosystem II stability/assembly factor-like uncharacterized protein